jgi:XisH protein
MPARDYYHDIVRQALINGGWEITHDPLRLQWGKKDMYFEDPVGQLLVQQEHIRLIVFNSDRQEVVQWIP